MIKKTKSLIMRIYKSMKMLFILENLLNKFSVFNLNNLCIYEQWVCAGAIQFSTVQYSINTCLNTTMLRKVRRTRGIIPCTTSTVQYSTVQYYYLSVYDYVENGEKNKRDNAMDHQVQHNQVDLKTYLVIFIFEFPNEQPINIQLL